jgi:hypothetical protein
MAGRLQLLLLSSVMKLVIGSDLPSLLVIRRHEWAAKTPALRKGK